MPKYYCDYCKSYLTHDTMSVRKSHLIGKNHIKYYCNYYEQKAKETGIWNANDTLYEFELVLLNKNAPGNTLGARTSTKKAFAAGQTEPTTLPPPPNLNGFPLPPPSVHHNTEDYQQAVLNYKRDTSSFD